MNPFPEDEELSVPEDPDAERALLSTLCASGAESATVECVAVLQPSDFVHPAHRAVMEALKDVLDQHGEVNPLSLKAALEHRGKLETVGGYPRLIEILNGEEVGKPMALVHRLQELRARRELMKVASKVLRSAPDASISLEDIQSVLREVQEGNVSTLALSSSKTLEVVRWADLKDCIVPSVKWAWEPFFPAVPFGLLAALPGTGKSFLALQIVAASATGLPLFGRPTCGPAGAGLLALEDDVNVVHRRLKAIRESYGNDWTPEHDDLLDRNLRILVRGRKPLEGLTGSAAAHELAHMAREIGAAMQTTQDSPAILFIDTMNAVNSGDENSNTEARSLTATIFGLHDALGCSVYALHHLRKAGSGKNAPVLTDRLDPELVRGAGAFVGSARAVVQFGWILPNEAQKAGLEVTNCHRRYVLMALTKINDGPLSPWMLLEHSQEYAGILAPVAHGEEALAALRGGNAMEDLSQAETILMDIHKGLGRDELMAKHYPEDPRADAKLKGMLQNLRRRQGWLTKGGMKLTVIGFQKVQELGRQDAEAVNPEGSESESWPESA